MSLFGALLFALYPSYLVCMCVRHYMSALTRTRMWKTIMSSVKNSFTRNHVGHFRFLYERNPSEPTPRQNSINAAHEERAKTTTTTTNKYLSATPSSNRSSFYCFLFTPFQSSDNDFNFVFGRISSKRRCSEWMQNIQKTAHTHTHIETRNKSYKSMQKRRHRLKII